MLLTPTVCLSLKILKLDDVTDKSKNMLCPTTCAILNTEALYRAKIDYKISENTKSVA